MATIHKLTKDGATIFPATITDAVVHPQTGKTLTSMIKDYNVSELFPSEGIDGGNKYNLALAISVLNTHLSAAQKTGGIKLTFISSVSPYPTEEYYLGKSTWSGNASDWDQRFEVGDVIADPSGSWEPGTAEQYIDQQVGVLNTNLTSEIIARQNGDADLRTQLQSEQSTRADQDGNLLALIQAGLRDGDALVFDTVPTQNSANPVTSGGIYSTLKDPNIGFVDDEPTTDSNNLVKSGGVYKHLYESRIPIEATTENNRTLNEQGNAVYNASCRVKKYPVVAGKKYYVNISKDSDYVYQFSSSDVVSTADRVGDTIATAFEGYLLAPEGATYLIVSELQTNTSNEVSELSEKDIFILSKIDITEDTPDTYTDKLHQNGNDFYVANKQTSSLAKRLNQELDIFREYQIVDQGETKHGRINGNIYFESENYNCKFVEVHAGESYKFDTEISTTLSGYSAIAFSRSYPVNGVGTVNILSWTQGTYENQTWVASYDGYLIIEANVASLIVNTVLKKATIVNDGGSSIDQSSNKGWKVVQNPTNNPVGWIDTRDNTLKDNSTYKCLYYKVNKGEKLLVLGERSSIATNPELYAFASFFASSFAPQMGDVMTSVLEAYTNSMAYLNNIYTAPDDGYIVIMQNPYLPLYAYVYTEIPAHAAKMVMPHKLYAVVGDTLQIFKRGCTDAVDDNDYNIQILVRNTKFKDYPRYLEYTPEAGDIGTVQLTGAIKDCDGNIIDYGVTELITVSAGSNPASAKKVLSFGDSGTTFGQWPSECRRRLCSSDVATPTMPAGRNFSNIDLYGSMKKNNAGYFGVGGWSWGNYTDKRKPGFIFQVSNVTDLWGSPNAVYTNNGHSYIVTEAHITGGSGWIRVIANSLADTPQNSGTLTKTGSEPTDETITFSSYSADTANPLWDSANNKMSFKPYVDDFCGGSVDLVVFWLGANDKSYDYTQMVSDAKTVLRTLHTEYPSAKAVMVGMYWPSMNGGLAKDYANEFASNWAGISLDIEMFILFNKTLYELSIDSEFSGYVDYINVASQFDNINNLPTESKQVNTRNATTEIVGSNGIHATNEGYYQLADAIYRYIIAMMCQ